MIPFLERDGIKIVPGDTLARSIHLSKERARTILELAQALKTFIAEDVEIDPKLQEKFLTPEKTALLKEVITILEGLQDFGEASIKAAMEGFIQSKGIKLGEIAQPIRVTLTGGTISPGIFEVIAVLGKAKTLHRLKRIAS